MTDSVIPAAAGMWFIEPYEGNEVGEVACEASIVTAWLVEDDGSHIRTHPIMERMDGYGIVETFSQAYRRPDTDGQIVYFDGTAEEAEQYAIGKFKFWSVLIRRKAEEREAERAKEREQQEAAERFRAQNGDAT